uniref:Uncharacterized protein n=1 Tax=Anguilla anguilla TaxID=7936 RepID=A0A0E9RQN1_ANGAN
MVCKLVYRCGLYIYRCDWGGDPG